jgi:ABC-type nitrate/sulfonate/bicarbonate transport system ATPase subunit
MTAPMIVVKNLDKDFPPGDGGHGWKALDSVSLSVNAGEFVAILGPSGCGKSTLLNILAGLESDFKGEVLVHGYPVGRDAGRKVRVAYLFQEPRLLLWRTVRGNVEFGLEAAGFPRGEWGSRADEWMRLVGLKDFADFYPLQLSGGMQQRAAIARAFAVEPEVLLMDEPFSALDELTARRLRQELLALWETHRRTVVFVTHNSVEAAFLADRIMIMKRGPASTICDEIPLNHLKRPRSYDSEVQFETQREVVRRLLQHVGEA